MNSETFDIYCYETFLIKLSLTKSESNLRATIHLHVDKNHKIVSNNLLLMWLRCFTYDVLSSTFR